MRLDDIPPALVANGTRGHFDVVHRRTGELLGEVWRTGRGWSASGPDGALRIADRLGHRQGCVDALIALLIDEERANRVSRRATLDL